MTAHRTRRATRSAGLLVVGALAALSLTACGSAGHDAAAGSEKKVSGSVSAAHSTGDGNGPGAAKATANGAQAGMRTQTTTTRDATTSPTAPSKAAPTVRTQTLPDGSKAQIHKLGTQHYLLKIVHRGDVLGTMEANHRDAGLDANDMFIVLTKDGRVQAWMGGGHEGPGTFQLMGGWTAKVTKKGEDHYSARITGDAGGVSTTLEANGLDAGAEINRVYIVLSAGGVISAHV